MLKAVEQEKETLWAFSDNGAPSAPMTRDELVKLIRSGRIDGSTFVWSQGMRFWRRIWEINELRAELLPRTPAPATPSWTPPELFPGLPPNLRPVDPAETDETIDFRILCPGSREAFEGQRCYAREHRLPVEVENKVGLRLRLIPPGTFEIGSGDSAESTQGHTVSVPHHFWMGVHPVTRFEYAEVIRGDLGSAFLESDNGIPMTGIDWCSWRTFCREMAIMEYADWDCYRWPTESEWEYACRAGTRTRYAGELTALGWFRSNNGSEPGPVCRKLPNAFGLFDMYGTVWEWCQDVWHGSWQEMPKDGPERDAEGSGERVCRGGCITSTADQCSSTARNRADAGYGGRQMGFRVVFVGEEDTVRSASPS